MYSLVALLGLRRDAAASCAPSRRDPPSAAGRRRWPVGFAVALAAMLYTHNWALFFAMALRRAVARRCCALAPPPERRRAAARRRCSASASRCCSTCRGCRRCFPGRAHGRPVVAPPDLDDLLDVPARLLGDARPDRAAARRAAPASSRCWSARRGPALSRGRRAAGGRALVVAHRARRLAVLPGLAGLGRALPRRRAAAVAAAGGGRARARGRASGSPALVVVALLWYGDGRRTEKSNVREVAAAIGPSLAPGDLVVSTQPEQVPVLEHYLPRRAALRDALGAGRRPRRDRLARRRRAPRAARPPQRDLEPLLDALPPGRRLVARHADHLRHGPLAGAVDGARPRCARRSGPVRVQRPALRPRSPAVPRETRPNPLQATVLVKRAWLPRRRLRGAGSGRRRPRAATSTKRVPRAGARSASASVPPIRSASSRPIARPSPKPPSEPRGAAAVEALEDLLALLGRDARPAVGDLDAWPSSRPPASTRTGSPGGP